MLTPHTSWVIIIIILIIICLTYNPYSTHKSTTTIMFVFRCCVYFVHSLYVLTWKTLVSCEIALCNSNRFNGHNQVSMDERVSIRDNTKPLRKYGSISNNTYFVRNEHFIKHVVTETDTLQGLALKYSVTVNIIII